MTPLHIDLLLALHSAKPYGLPLDALLGDMRKLRHRDAALPQVETALRDLADKSLVTLTESGISTRWRCTALGSSTLQEEGLA